MLRQFVALIAMLGAGCHGFPWRQTEWSAPPGAECCGPQRPCAQPCAPPPAPCVEAPPPKQPPPQRQAPPEQAAPTPERVERVQPQAQIAQEVMLVPRTVYVPYVAQTPVSPVRLSAVNTVPGRVTTFEERRELLAQPAPPSPPSRREEAAPPEREQLLEMCRQLSDKLNRIEEAQHRLSQTAPCPPTPQPCSPPQTLNPPKRLGPKIYLRQRCPDPQTAPVYEGPSLPFPPESVPAAPAPRE
jgi:hypothetical protein